MVEYLKFWMARQLLEDLKKVRGNGFFSHAEDLYAMGYRKRDAAQ